MGHGCESFCDPATCQQVCDGKLTSNGVPFQAQCPEDGIGDCHCEPSEDAYCARLFGDRYCGSYLRVHDVITCDAARCGDGQRTAVCQDRPQIAETCDRSATPNGCAGESETSCAGDCPVSCGDGICNVTGGETATGCPADCCGAAVACCVETNGCPSEELYSCPGDCCCCPAGAHCVQPAGTWICGI